MSYFKNMRKVNHFAKLSLSDLFLIFDLEIQVENKNFTNPSPASMYHPSQTPTCTSGSNRTAAGRPEINHTSF